MPDHLPSTSSTLLSYSLVGPGTMTWLGNLFTCMTTWEQRGLNHSVMVTWRYPMYGLPPRRSNAA